MTQNFTMDDIAKLLQASQKPPRKKKNLTADQEKAMKEKLAMMREKSLAARKLKMENKASDAVLVKSRAFENETTISKPIDNIPNLEIKRNVVSFNQLNDELFEKKYNSKFEKIDETMGHIKSSLEEMKELKKQKALERQKAKEEKVQEKVQESNINVEPVIINNPKITLETSVSTKSVALPIKNSYAIPKIPDYKNMFKK